MDDKKQQKNHNHLHKNKPIAATSNPVTKAAIFESNSMITIKHNILHPAALALYVIVALFYFSLPVIGNFNTKYIGSGADPTQFMWSLRWIIYAITHGTNPLYTNVIWMPGGYDLSFNTFTPGISLLSIPLTVCLGIVRTFNIWQIINPALGAYFAFVLCYYLTKKYIYSLVGGYVFGFSSFEIAQTTGHLQVSTIFLIPLMVYLVLLLADNKIKRLTFGLFFSLMLIFQFLFSLEVFTTFALFGVATMLISYLYVPETNRALIRRCIMPIVLSYVACLVLVSPYLYDAIKNAPTVAVHDPSYWVDDLLNFVIPTPLTFLGKYFSSINSTFPGNWAESDSYFGVGFLTIAVLFAQKHWRKPDGKILFLAFLIPAIASLGPTVHILGKPTFPSPFWPLAYLPFIKDAQPNRMVVFASLPMAIMVAMWLSNSKCTWPRIVLTVLSLALILPSFPYPSSATGVPAFISTSEYKKYIAKGSNVLVIPYSYSGNSMLWQAETNFYFTMVDGYLGPPPSRCAYLPVVQSFFTGEASPNLDKAVRAFIYFNNVRTIIIDSSLPKNYVDIFNGLGISPKLVGGVWLYQVSDAVMQGIKAQNLSFEAVNYLSPYDQLFHAVKSFLNRGGNLNNLYPQTLEQMGFLSTDFGYGSGSVSNWTRTGQWIGNWGDDVGIGSEGNSESMVPIINKYKGIAEKIYFPYPKIYVPGADAQGQLLMVFKKASVLNYQQP